MGVFAVGALVVMASLLIGAVVFGLFRNHNNKGKKNDT